MIITTRKHEERRLERIVQQAVKEADYFADEHGKGAYATVCATHAAGQRMGAKIVLRRFKED
jgi:hypothetical protein